MSVPPSSEALPGRLLTAVIVLSCLVVLPMAFDATALPHLVVVMGSGVVFLAFTALVWVARGVLDLPTGPTMLALVAFVGGGAVAAIASGDVSTALVGRHSRWAGLLTYVTCAVLFWAVLSAYRTRSPAPLAWGLLAAGSGVALLGLAQTAGLPGATLGFEEAPGNVLGMVSTLGNPNFAAGVMAIAFPMAFGLLLIKGAPAWQRLAALTAALTLAIAMLLNGSQQGPLAAVAGTSIVLLVIALRGEGPVWQGVVLALVAVMVLGLLMVGLGITGRGPLAGFIAQGHLETRLWYWQAAASMFTDRPLLGVGLDRYGDFYREYRVDGAVRALGAVSTADEPHSVPLGMFAQGGLLLGVSYLAFVGTIIWAAFRGARSVAVDRLPLLAGFTGAFVAYQAQSFVSIDVPPLPFLHFATAGAVVALGAPPAWRQFGRARRRAGSPKIGWARIGIGLAAAGLLWVAVLPLRADIAMGRALAAAEAGEGREALDQADRAVDLAPWQERYWFERGRLLLSAGMRDEAARSFGEVLDRAPRNVPALMTAARVSAAEGKADVALSLYRRATGVDPLGPEVVMEAAAYFMEHSVPLEAVRALQPLVRVLDSRPDVWARYGDALARAGRRAEALQALTRAQELDHQHVDVVALANRLQTGAAR